MSFGFLKIKLNFKSPPFVHDSAGDDKQNGAAAFVCSLFVRSSDGSARNKTQIPKWENIVVIAGAVSHERDTTQKRGRSPCHRAIERCVLESHLL